ncbi:MAG: lipocalin family protein [Cyclobacteriaceae bacterium]
MNSMKFTFFLGLLILTQACSIVELDEEIDEVTDQSEPLSEVDLGTSILPTEEEMFGELLHGGDTKTWISSEFSIEGISGFLDCRLDDTVTLKADGTYEYDGGSELCGAEDDQRNRSGNWSFDFADQELVFEPGSDEESRVKVVSLEGNLLTFTGVYENDIFGSFDISGRYTSN